MKRDSWTEMGSWSRLEDHLADARHEADQMCDALKLAGNTRTALVEGSGLHDLGRAHPNRHIARADASLP